MSVDPNDLEAFRENSVSVARPSASLNANTNGRGSVNKPGSFGGPGFGSGFGPDFGGSPSDDDGGAGGLYREESPPSSLTSSLPSASHSASFEAPRRPASPDLDERRYNPLLAFLGSDEEE